MVENQIRLRCVCGYEWIYHGNKLKFACCPSCRSTISIKKNRVVGSIQQGGETV